MAKTDSARSALRLVVDEVRIPHPRKPAIGMRTVLLRHCDKRVKRWVKAKVKVEVLLEGVLYVVVDDRKEPAEGVDLRRGNVLMRNLKSSPGAIKRYSLYKQGVYQALRGISDVKGRLTEVELPRNRRWHDTLRWMLSVAYGVRTASADQVEAYKRSGLEAANENLLVRDEGKVVALRRTLSATSLTDSRGRLNPERLPLILWSAADLVDQRQRDIRCVGRYMDRRAFVLTCYVDELVRLVDGCEGYVRRLHDDAALFDRARGGIAAEQERARKAKREAELLGKGAKVLSGVVARPYGPRSFRHIAKDLQDAGSNLRVGVYGEAHGLLHRVLRSIALIKVMWRMQQTLTVLHYVRSRKLVLAGRDVERLKAVIEGYVKSLDRDDIDHDFEMPVAADAVTWLEGALEAFAGYSDRPENAHRARVKIDAVHESVERACALF